MDLNKIPYKDHREVWHSEQFLREFFKIKNEDDYRKNAYVRNFLEKLDKIPIQRSYTFVGYGSIMNEGDVPRTLPSYSNHREGIVSGYQRIFNVGFDTAFLNVEKSEYSAIRVALMEFNYYDLLNLINREQLYDFVTVNVVDSDGSEIEALMVVGDETFVVDTLTPQLNYLHLCLTGAMKLGGLASVNNFLETICYCETTGDQIMARDYLKNLSLTNYMIKNEYSSR